MRIDVEFRDAGTGKVIETWRSADHWVPKGEQVHLGSTLDRYEVVRVEHLRFAKYCYVRKMQ